MILMRFKNLVITGTGRSGTSYASGLFTGLGIPTTHQRVFHDEYKGEELGWGPLVGDSSALAAPFVKLLPEHVLVIHQVRHPALVVSSLLRNSHVPGQKARLRRGEPPGMYYYAHHLPGLQEISGEAEKACALWVAWNRLAEQIADRPNYILHRVEDYSPEFLKSVLESFGLPWTSWREQLFMSLPRNAGATGTTGRMDFSTVAGAQREPLLHMARRYGYEV